MEPVKKIAESYAKKGPSPNQRIPGQRGGLSTPSAGRFIQPCDYAQGPKESKPRQPTKVNRGSFAIGGKEGVDRG